MENLCDGKCENCKELNSCEDPRKEYYLREKKIKAGMSKVKHKIAVLSGKGGVGKSTVTANLAQTFALNGKNQVGILDADITGPSIPKLLGIREKKVSAGLPGIFPVKGPHGIKVISMDFFLEKDETPVIWRGPMKSIAIKQFLGDVEWGYLDYLLIDLPPGTGDEALTIMQSIPEINGAVIVTIPSDLSQIVVKKAVTFCRQLEIPVIGVIENMSGFVCPKCGYEEKIFSYGGGKKIANALAIPFLGEIPLERGVCEDSDKGTSFLVNHPNSPAAKSFLEIAGKICDYLNLN